MDFKCATDHILEFPLLGSVVKDRRSSPFDAQVVKEAPTNSVYANGVLTRLVCQRFVPPPLQAFASQRAFC